MGIAVASKARYENAIRKLFPQGDYWEEQFADPESDVSFFIKAKVDELIRFRERMSNLYNESRPETTIELIADWERVLLNKLNTDKTLAERQALLISNENEYLNRAVLESIAETHGFNIIDIFFPYRPAFFGFSNFGLDVIASPTSWQVIFFSVDTHGNGNHIAQFEALLRAKLLTNYIPQFFYNGDK